ncbi:MAG: ribose 5-phosphate isomerase B [Candidatus Aureabacteria bacterium]|nr:ribose 5-phosphate isomerase B [Candidatus Auribacterota bacterium]
MKIAIASDHGGFELKEFVKEYLLKKEYEVDDFGCPNKDSVDYPDFGIKAARAVADKKADKGIVICTTGIGMSMVANKVRGIRAALCRTPKAAEMSRKHNDANVLALGGAFVEDKTAVEILDIWLNTEFEGGRHGRRVDKITDIERSNNDGIS